MKVRALFCVIGWGSRFDIRVEACEVVIAYNTVMQLYDTVNFLNAEPEFI